MSAGTNGSGRRTLLADIGGTNARFALHRPGGGSPCAVERWGRPFALRTDANRRPPSC